MLDDKMAVSGVTDRRKIPAGPLAKHLQNVRNLNLEVGQHPLGASLRTIHRDNTEVRRADGLNPGGRNAAWFANVPAIATAAG